MTKSNKPLHWAHTAPETLPKVTIKEKKILGIVAENKLVTTRKVELETGFERRYINLALGNLYRKGYVKRINDVFPTMWEYLLGAP